MKNTCFHSKRQKENEFDSFIVFYCSSIHATPSIENKKRLFMFVHSSIQNISNLPFILNYYIQLVSLIVSKKSSRHTTPSIENNFGSFYFFPQGVFIV